MKTGKLLALILPLVLVMVLAVACGDDEPESAPAAPAGVTAAEIQAIIAGIQIPTGLSQADVSKVVSEAMAAQPGISGADLQAAVDSAVAKAVTALPTVAAGVTAADLQAAIAGIQIPEGLSESDVSSIVTAAMSAQPGLSAAAVSTIVSDAIAAQPGISAADLQDAVDEAVAKAVAAMPVARPVPATPAFVARGKYGGNPPWAITNDPGDLDLHSGASLQTSAIVALPRYSQLVEWDPIGWDKLVGDLATGWEVSEDGMSYRFFIHPFAKWHDGVAVTAKDIVFSLDRIADPDERRTQAASAIKPFYEHGTARVVDDKTVDVPVKFPTGAFMPFLAFPLVAMYPEHIAANLTQEQVSGSYEPMIGSGPFLMKEFKRGISIEWEANPDYFKEGLPFWDGFTMFNIGEPTRMIASLQAGQVMGWSAIFGGGLKLRDVQQLENDTNGQIVPITLPAWGGWGLLMNPENPPFDNPNVRKAVALVLDRVEILKAVWDGVGQQGQPIPGVTSLEESRTTWPGWRYVDADGNLITEDPVQVVGAQKHPDDIAEAIRLIEEAGAMGFQGTMMEYNIPNWINMVTVIAQQLKTHFDWDLEFSIVDLNAVIEEAYAGNYDLYSDGSLIDVNDPAWIIPEWYMEGGGRNYSEWSDPKIDRLFEEQWRAPTASARRVVLKEIETALRTEVAPVWITIMWAEATGAMNVKVRNFHMPTLTDGGLSGTAIVAAMEHLWFDPDAQPGQGLGE